MNWIQQLFGRKQSLEAVWNQAEQRSIREMDVATKKYNVAIENAKTGKFTRSRRRGSMPWPLFDEDAFAAAISGYGADTKRLYARFRRSLLRAQRRQNV